jgi:nucleoside phosphorylase
MEAAAVAWVCEKAGVPFTALKVTTDLVDGEEPTEIEFSANLKFASERLSEAMFSLIHELKN